jgi:cytochrome c oxidase accessory protein FixG
MHKAADMPSSDATSPLYADRQKVYPKAVSGPYRRLKWALLVVFLSLYYGGPWLRWERGPGAPDQALLIDMTAPRAYFFSIEIWPQEVYFITGLLAIGALGLFLATALFGRVWCGYACPQTVWTDLFMQVERWIEGDRAARMRRDQAAMHWGKFVRQSAKHLAWLAIAFATGGAWMLYFADAPRFVADFFSGRASLEGYVFVGLFTVSTYLLAGLAREQVCTYMCPWPRFQAAMLDDQSLVVTYQEWRGEKRGPHKAGTTWEGRGDCIDCGQCMTACPTGIDIRDGLQLECIGCALCIDSCNAIMAKVGRPLNLIDFSSQAQQKAKAEGRKAPWRPLRPRTLLYAVLLMLALAIMAVALLSRHSVSLSASHDRAPLFVLLADGSVRNGYTLKLVNKGRQPVSYRLSVQGLAAGVIMVQETGATAPAAGGSLELFVKGDAVTTYRLLMTAPPAIARERERRPIRLEAHPVPLSVVASSGRDLRRPADSVAYETVFLAPGPSR